jgi:divalent metal cation (Fe/Co/Zn/Cd) transporter
MSRIIKGTLSVSTRYVGSTVKDNFEIEVDDNATEDEINKEIEQLWIDFSNNEIDGGWNIESDEIINE